MAFAVAVAGCDLGGPSRPDPLASFGGASLTIQARGLAFDPDIATMPAGQPLRLILDNQDAGVPHDLHVFQGETDFGTATVVTGPGLTAIELPALPPGRYQFECTIHPSMIGTFIVQVGGVAGPSTPDDTPTPADTSSPDPGAATDTPTGS